MRPKDLLKCLCFCFENKFPVLLKGAPGIGKSDIVNQAAEKTHYKLMLSHPVVSDPTDYKGLPFKIEGSNKAEFAPFGDLEKLINANEPTVFFLDDLGQAPMSVQAACMQLILARKINNDKISDKVVFVAATNRRQDKAGVTGILEPVKSRFAAILELTVHVEDWVAWAIANDMPTELISFVRFRPNLLHDFKPTGDIENSPCPRTLAYVGKMFNAGLQASANESIMYEMFAGSSGKGFAAEFTAYLATYGKIPTFAEILSKPNEIEVPESPDMLYAVSGMLGARVDQNTFDKAMVYITRMPIEFQTLCIKDAARRKRAIGQTRAFIDWSSKHIAITL